MAKKSAADDFLKAVAAAGEIDVEKAVNAAPRGSGIKKEELAKALKLEAAGDVATVKAAVVGVQFRDGYLDPKTKKKGAPSVALVLQFLKSEVKGIANQLYYVTTYLEDTKIKTGRRAGETWTMQEKFEEFCGTLKKCGVDMAGIKTMKDAVAELPGRITKAVPIVQILFKQTLSGGKLYTNDQILGPAVGELDEDLEEEDGLEPDDEEDEVDTEEEDSDDEEEEDSEEEDDEEEEEEPAPPPKKTKAKAPAKSAKKAPPPVEEDEDEEDEEEEEPEDDEEEEPEDDEEEDEEEEEDDEPAPPEKKQKFRWKEGRVVVGCEVTMVFPTSRQVNVKLDNGTTKQKQPWSKLLDKGGNAIYA